ncbi:MAG: sigma-70 family RNA polymerase sigma factor [Acidobacteriota bacterium]
MEPRDSSQSNPLLIVRCQLGEPEAFDELVETWHSRLWSYIRRLTDDNDAAAEAIQETWLRVLRGLPRLRDRERFAPWMHRIARNVVMDRLRRDYARPPSSEVDPDSLQRDRPLTSVDIDLTALRQGMVSLPLLERDVLTLFYVQDLSLLETAEVLEIPVGTVKSRLHRARSLLREKMQLVSEGVCR